MSPRQAKRVVVAPLMGGGQRALVISSGRGHPVSAVATGPTGRGYQSVTTGAGAAAVAPVRRGPPSGPRPAAVDFFIDNGENGAVAGAQALAGLGKPQLQAVKLAGKWVGRAFRPLGLLGEGFDIYDDYQAGKPLDLIATRSGARIGALAGASKAGALVMTGPGAAAGGAMGLGAGGVGAAPGAAIGGVVGAGIGGFVGGMTADAAGLDDLAADQAERSYWWLRRQYR